MRPLFDSRLRTLLVVVTALALTACVYRLDTQQGNLLDTEQVEQVEVGMTRSQVRFLLGTPMVADSFDQSRWDYVFWQRQGRSGRVQTSHVTVWFDGDSVQRIERPSTVAAPTESPVAASTDAS
jgi:outer membrane protein assembly factor BamE